MKINELSIKKLMERQEIHTQAELARRCGLSPVTLNQIIKGRRTGFSSATLDKLCAALAAQPGEFLFYQQ